MITDSIQMSDITEELSKLWDSEQGQNKTRASLFNLVLYIQESHEHYYQTLIKKVVSQFPCRVILIRWRDHDGSYLRTSVNSETVNAGEQKIFCEIIQIEVSGKFTERVPFIVLPQIIPDLPVYLLWAQDPTIEGSILPHLETIADRIIFDSKTTLNLRRYSRSVLELMQKFHCDIGDLNWSASSGWRHLFFQTFNTPEAFLSLTQCTRIRIQFNSNPSRSQIANEIEAAYFQAWLASRLNWQFQSIENNEGNIRLVYKSSVNEVIVILTPVKISEGSQGAIGTIEIENDKQENYSFKRELPSLRVMIQRSQKDLCDLPSFSVLNNPSEGKEIIQEIFYPSGGQHYQEMLNLLSSIPWKEQA